MLKVIYKGIEYKVFIPSARNPIFLVRILRTPRCRKYTYVIAGISPVLKYTKRNYAGIAKAINKAQIDNLGIEIKVESKSGNGHYRVRKYADVTICRCLGFIHHGYCWHIDYADKLVDEGGKTYERKLDKEIVWPYFEKKKERDKKESR